MDDRLPDSYEGSVLVAVIGGTGLSSLPGFKPVARLPLGHKKTQTPWGNPSGPITILSHAREGHDPMLVAFLPRHGIYHQVAPHEVNSRANIAVLRNIGVRCIVAFSAVGSLKEEVKPRDFVVVDQIVDRTKGVRPWTFFEGGLVGHVSMADPFDEDLRQIIIKAVGSGDVLQGSEDSKSTPSLHKDGSVVVIEGPTFSTRAESLLYRSWGLSCINMSALPEAQLAREAELSYAMICMATDYDAWHESTGAVTVEMVMGHMNANAENAKRAISAILDALSAMDDEKLRDVKNGAKYEGQSKFAGGVTKKEGRIELAVKKIEFLFPDFSVEPKEKKEEKTKTVEPASEAK